MVPEKGIEPSTFSLRMSASKYSAMFAFVCVRYTNQQVAMNFTFSLAPWCLEIFGKMRRFWLHGGYMAATQHWEHDGSTTQNRRARPRQGS
jgi:hypothetical protein